MKHLATLLLLLASLLPCRADSVQQAPNLSGITGLLGSIRSANMNSTADQAIAIRASVSAYQITGIVATNCSGSVTLAAGGVYPAASKGGTPVVAATQVYSALTSSTVQLGLTVAATPLVTRYIVQTLYFSLTTAHGSAMTCDIYVVGLDLT